MTAEWLANAKRPPLLVEVTWTDACMDASFSCALEDVGERAHLQHGRRSDGRMIYLRTEGRDARIVLCSLYDAPGVADDKAWVENFMTIPWGWVEKIRVVRGPVIYTRDGTPKVKRASTRKRAPAPPAQAATL